MVCLETVSLKWEELVVFCLTGKCHSTQQVFNLFNWLSIWLSVVREGG